MGIVRFALKYPHTFYVLAGLMLFLGISAIVVAPKDIFPSIDIPVVTVIWQETGLTPDQMEQRVTTYSEYSISSNVSDIRNMESQTLSGLTVQKIYFQPNVNIDLAISQIVSATNAIRALMPAGIQPPIIVQYSASSVPVLQLSLSSDTLNEQQLYDYGIYQIRQALAPIPGITLPTPYGGKYRQIMVDLDPDALRARGITPADVLNAVNAQNLTLPSGDAKLGERQMIVRVNAMLLTIDALNRVPIKQVGQTTVYLSDVAHVRDGWAVQQNIVHSDGKRSVLLTIIKNGDASTLDVVNRVKAALPAIQKAAPVGMQIHLLFDQSVFVTQAITSVVREGTIAAGLTALMILVFLGSWRSTLVVMVSIPLSILASLAVLTALGQTINTMTLGGLALAVGILVDDSTVTIENTHRLLEDGTEFDTAVLNGAAGIAVPTLISTLAICCVFVSVFFLQGAARYLFTPLAMAVVFAMIASYGISRTLTPIIIRLLLRSEHENHGAAPGWLGRFHTRFNAGFDRFKDFYDWLLAGIMRRRVITPLVACVIVGGAAVLSLHVGRDFFPQVDAGLIQLHVRAPARTRIERTEQIFASVEQAIRQQIPPKELGLVLDNIGLPQRVYNMAFTDGTTIGVNDGEILLQLNEGHAPTADYIKKLRQVLPVQFPSVQFYFQPADLATQVLNFGVPSQIDVQVQGQDRAANIAIAGQLRQQLANISGLVDVHLQQELDAPELSYTIDRTRAQQLGLTLQQVANDLNISLSSSEQVSPNFWTDPKNGIPYYFAVQTPEYRLSSKNALDNTPIGSSLSDGAVVPETFGNVASAHRESVESVYNHSNIQPVYDVYASLQDRDLGSAAADIQRVVHSLQGKLGPGDRIVIRGQIESMNSAFSQLTIGLLFAAVFVYALMVVNYQSFLDPLAVILALPGAGSGIILMLYVTGTTLSVPSMMGAIMSVGVASANSILLVTFAREQREAGMSAFDAAMSAGTTRLRPVLMTAAAMIVGMIPMAIGGPGEEQNAVLARAVIGGVAVGTMTTLLFVPYLYSVIGQFERRRAAQPLAAQGHDMNEQSPTPPDSLLRDSEQATPADPRRERHRRRTARWLGFGIAVLVAVLVATGMTEHAAQRAEAVDTLQAMRAAVPIVRIAAVKSVDTPRQIDLPGTMQPFDSATLFARATGYISKRNVDIGSRVRKGDVLAIISAPDLDAQLEQARGQLAQMQAAFVQAQANRDLAHATNNRTTQLVQQGWDSKQQGDTDRLGLASQIAAVAVAQANVQAQQAQVDRLKQLTDFERVVAPFNGVITARQVDVGSLVTADANSGTPLFSIARTDVLRVQVYVPQDDYFGLKDGEQATVTVPELPGQTFHGTVARNASVLQQQTRTLLTEVDVDNASGRLAGGLYGIVHLDEPRQEPVFILPSQAVIFNQNGLSAAVYRDGTLQLRHLDLAADDGAQVEIRSGLQAGDRIILDPPVNAVDGMRVATASPPASFTATRSARS